MRNMPNKIVAQNRKARHDYFIIDSLECGIVLTGTEIKSVRAGNLNLKDSYASIERGELWLMGMHVSPYEKGSYYNHEPERDRKLLVGRQELVRLGSKVREGADPGSPFGLHKGRAKGEGGACPGEGKDLLRQARRPGGPGCEARYGPRGPAPGALRGMSPRR